MGRLWFGTKQHFQEVPSPAPGVVRRSVYSGESGTLERGGGFSSRSRGYHVEWDFTFPVSEAHGADGLDIFNAFAAGMYDDYSTDVDGRNPNDLIYFADWMDFRSNLFYPGFASPMLGLRDLPSIGAVISHTATAANPYRQPQRTVTFNITHPSASLPVQIGRQCLIPIPPGYSLRWGWSGSRTGTGVVRAEAHHKTGGSPLVQNAAPLAVTDPTRMNQSISGDTYDYAVFGLARSSAVASTVSPASMMAQLFPIGDTPVLTGEHVHGRGVSGCEFGDALPEDYMQVYDPHGQHLKGMSFSLKEIGVFL